MKLGVVSDTHGYIHPKVYDIFTGADTILHAGDIGTEDVITSLQAMAPVHAVHGNVDSFPLTERYPAVISHVIGGVRICLLHDIQYRDSAEVRAAITAMPGREVDLFICGHTHRALLQRQGDALFFNPGSAGKRRFSLRLSVGLVTISDDGRFVPEIVYLD